MVALNPVIGDLGAHPFPRLARLLAAVQPPAGLEVVDLSIGEPRIPPPTLLAEEIAQHGDKWASYPPNNGPDWFRRAAAGWLERRNNLPEGAVGDHVIPTAGAREALYQVAFLVDPRQQGRSLLAMPTPHYAPYRGAALAAGMEPLYLAAGPGHGYLPDLAVLSGERAKRTAMLFLCTPSNPEGVIAPADYVRDAIELARRHDFVLVVDECYSEIYRDDPPVGALEVCWSMRRSSEDPFRNVLVINSLSKRSSAAGLRAGLVAGDAELVSALVHLRAYAAGTTPLPNLAAAAALLNDEEHVATIRQCYRDNYAVADEVLGGAPGYRSPAAGMFLWLRVHDDEEAALAAWRTAALRVVPGSYLGLPGWNGDHPGAGHVRVALVHQPDQLRHALRRLRPIMEKVGVAAEVTG